MYQTRTVAIGVKNALSILKQLKSLKLRLENLSFMCDQEIQGPRGVWTAQSTLVRDFFIFIRGGETHDAPR